MKLIQSKQVNIPFVWCADPIVIDKRKSWGDSEENFQKGPNGAFLKMKNDKEISHLVQPNSDKTAPVGWIYTGRENLYDKLPIFVGGKVNKGEWKCLNTLDGEMLKRIPGWSIMSWATREITAQILMIVGFKKSLI